MSQDIQSIEDLISSSQGGEVGEESVFSKFQKKQSELKTKELEKIAEKKALGLGVPYINLFSFPISPEALSMIREEEAVKAKVACFYYDGNSFRLAATNPETGEAMRIMGALQEQYHCLGKIFLVSEYSFDYVLRLYKSIPKVRVAKRGVEVSEEDLNKFSESFTSFKDLQKLIEEAEVSDIVTMIMASSIKSGASDIHIEAEENIIKVRFRIDGVLHDAASISKELWKKIISRMKVLTKVKINITDRPQDGRVSIITSNERIDVRASFLPTNYGESVVMRLLRSTAVDLKFSDLGIRGRAFEQLQKEVNRPNGMIITTGPTGSGKTTTLYAILKELNKSETKIITIEDPIEYQLEGINQSQTSENYTFAQGLKSIVRQDPDVVMVGEIRDLETAEIAIQAALTGHLVLSTIHTNDAAGTVPRFLSMGTKPFLLAPALNAMIGQRLTRRVCEKCKEEIQLDEESLAKVLKLLNKLPEKEKKEIDFDNLKFYQGKGCDYCQGIGYKGRIGVYEIMAMNGEIEKMILSGNVSEYDMKGVAAEMEMITMAQDGILKALDGLTSVDEVFRVAGEE